MDIEEPLESELGELIFDNQGDHRGYLRNNFRRMTGCRDRQGLRHSLARYKRFSLPEKFVESVLSQIPELRPHVRDWGYQMIYHQEENPVGAMMLTHTDGERRGKHCIQAVWRTGGPSVKTSWWKEPEKSIERNEALTVSRPHSDLELLGEIEFEPLSWAMFRTDVLHSVQTIKTIRTSFSVGFTDDDLYDFLVKKYSVN